jgi:hypothetical protein
VIHFLGLCCVRFAGFALLGIAKVAGGAGL